MGHASPIVFTLVVGLVFAFVGGNVALRLRLPPLVGYLLAGVAVGPFTPGVVADSHVASELAEVGVMLLMFGVGMHFSLADLLAVSKVAVPGALLHTGLSATLGLGVAYTWGWSLGSGLVLGLALSVASTVVFVRALESSGRMDSALGHAAVGWLIVEDLLMVLVMVLLPALSGVLGGKAPTGGHGLALTLEITLVKVLGFAAVMGLAGAKALPWLLNRVAKTGSHELFTLAVVAIALGVAFESAQLFGVSFALGAFVAGLVIRSSDHSHQAGVDSLPLQEAFSALFFVSVGMLFDPHILVREPGRVLALLGVVLVGKAVLGFLLSRVLKLSPAVSLGLGAGLAQVGEFSFILVELGLALGLLPPEGRGLVLAVAITSITLNPAMFWLAGKLSSHPSAVRSQ